jgi:hypothetical protein
LARDLHDLLALLSIVTMGIVVLEGGARTVRGVPPGRWASRLSDVMLVLIGITAAGGLALLAGGHRPRDFLHLLYAVLAFGAIPVADQLARHTPPRRRALARFVGALVGFGVIARLFATG